MSDDGGDEHYVVRSSDSVVKKEFNSTIIPIIEKGRIRWQYDCYDVFDICAKKVPLLQMWPAEHKTQCFSFVRIGENSSLRQALSLGCVIIINRRYSTGILHRKYPSKAVINKWIELQDKLQISDKYINLMGCRTPEWSRHSRVVDDLIKHYYLFGRRA